MKYAKSGECGVRGVELVIFVMQRGPLDRYRMVLFLRTDLLRQQLVGIIASTSTPLSSWRTLWIHRDTILIP